jgi:hypothetical protein
VISAASTPERRFVLGFLIDLPGAYRIAHVMTPCNSDHYRGHKPMTLQLWECRWSGDYVDMALKTRTVDPDRENRSAFSMSFGELPDGEWFELIPLPSMGHGQQQSRLGDFTSCRKELVIDD